MGQKASSLALKKTFKFFEYSHYLYNKHGSFFLLKDYFIRQTLKQFFKQNKFMLNNLLILQSENKLQIIINFFSKKDLYRKLRFTKLRRKRFHEKKRLKKYQKKIQRKLIVARLLYQMTNNQQNLQYKASWKQQVDFKLGRKIFLFKSYKTLLNLNFFSRSTTQQLKQLKKNKYLKTRLTQTLFYFYLSVLWKKATNKLFVIYFLHKINIYLNTLNANLFFKKIKSFKHINNFNLFLLYSGSLLSLSNRFLTLKKTIQLKLLKTTNLSYNVFNKFFYFQKKKKFNFYSVNQLYKFNFFKKIKKYSKKFTYAFKKKKKYSKRKFPSSERRLHYLTFLVYCHNKRKQKKNRKRKFLLFKRNKRRKYKKTFESVYSPLKFFKKVYRSYELQDTFNEIAYKDSRMVRYYNSEELTPFIFRKKKYKKKKIIINNHTFIKQYNFFFKQYLIHKYNPLAQHQNLKINFYYQLYITTLKKKKNLKFRFKFDNRKILHFKKQRFLEKTPRLSTFDYISFYDRKKIYKTNKNKRKKFFFIFYYYNFNLLCFQQTKKFLSKSKFQLHKIKTTTIKTYKTLKIIKKLKTYKKQTFIFKKRKKKRTEQQKFLKIRLKKFKLAKSILRTLNKFTWFKKMRITSQIQPVKRIYKKLKKHSENLKKKNIFYTLFENHLQILPFQKKKIFLKQYFYTTFKLQKNQMRSKKQLQYIPIYFQKKKLKTFFVYKFSYFRILVQKYKYFLKKKKYLMSSLLQKLITKYILTKTVDFSKTALTCPRFKNRFSRFYKKPFIRNYRSFIYKYKRGKNRVTSYPKHTHRKYFNKLKLEVEKPILYRFKYTNPEFPYFYIRSLYHTHGHIPTFKLKSLFKQILQNALYRLKYHKYKKIYGFNPLSGKRSSIADTEAPLFGHYPLVFLHRRRRNKYIKRIRRYNSPVSYQASQILENSTKNSRQLLEKLTNYHLSFFYKQRLTPKINLKKTNTILLQKLSKIFKKYFKINNIQLCVYFKLYKFLQKYKQKKLILYNFNNLSFKKQKTIHTVNFSNGSFPATLNSFISFKHLHYKKFNNFTYFRILRQKFFTKKFFKNNELILILLNCLFFRTATVYLATYICTIFKKLKQHNLLLAHLDRLIKYFFKGFTYSLPISGLKFIIKGRINGVPRKKTRIYSYGQTQSQTLQTSFDYHQATAFTRYGTFGLRFWRYF